MAQYSLGSFCPFAKRHDSFSIPHTYCLRSLMSWHSCVHCPCCILQHRVLFSVIRQEEGMNATIVDLLSKSRLTLSKSTYNYVNCSFHVSAKLKMDLSLSPVFFVVSLRWL